MTNVKKQKHYIYNGLGFPILLKEAEFRKVGGKWLLKIDVEKVSDQVIKALPTKSAGLTGAEIRFIRTYFDLSKRALASELNVSHTAVNKWEDAEQEKAKIDPHVEITLRAFIKIRLHEDKDFSNFFKGLMDEAKKFADDVDNEPLSIAI
jgi:transcriptional regulator with XRE-family HTH domain